MTKFIIITIFLVSFTVQFTYSQSDENIINDISKLHGVWIENTTNEVSLDGTISERNLTFLKPDSLLNTIQIDLVQSICRIFDEEHNLVYTAKCKLNHNGINWLLLLENPEIYNDGTEFVRNSCLNSIYRCGNKGGCFSIRKVDDNNCVIDILNKFGDMIIQVSFKKL